MTKFKAVFQEGQCTLLYPCSSGFVRQFLGIGIVVLLFLVGAVHKLYAATIELFPSIADCSEEFEIVANSLQPGDELVLHGGTYSQHCRRAITVNGTAANPIIIRGAAGERPLLTRPANNIETQNNIEIVMSSYLRIRGLRSQGGSMGIRFIGGHHITIEECEIFETGNVAIAMNRDNTDSFVIRRNHIHHTGLSTSGPTEGEGIYIGCTNNVCRTTNSLIEGNYIHHLRGTSDGGNDGIEIKAGSYGNIIRNNVIHDTNIGKQYPCIFIYGGGSEVNLVEGNVMWNCGQAIQVVADAVIWNNLILDSSIAGITSVPHSQVAQMRNVTIVNNTIVGHPECLHLRWSKANHMVLANNAIYCSSSTAVNALGLSGSGIVVQSNYSEGRLLGASLDHMRFFSGGNVISTFVNAEGLNLWPTPHSVLIGNAEAGLTPKRDFNESLRTRPYDVGAYETEGLVANPGWKVAPGFKRVE